MRPRGSARHSWRALAPATTDCIDFAATWRLNATMAGISSNGEYEVTSGGSVRYVVHDRTRTV